MSFPSNYPRIRIKVENTVNATIRWLIPADCSLLLDWPANLSRSWWKLFRSMFCDLVSVYYLPDQEYRPIYREYVMRSPGQGIHPEGIGSRAASPLPFCHWEYRGSYLGLLHFSWISFADAVQFGIVLGTHLARQDDCLWSQDCPGGCRFDRDQLFLWCGWLI